MNKKSQDHGGPIGLEVDIADIILWMLIILSGIFMIVGIGYFIKYLFFV